MVVDFYVVKWNKKLRQFLMSMFLFLFFYALEHFPGSLFSCSGTKIPAFMSRNFTKSATPIVESSQFWCSMLFFCFQQIEFRSLSRLCYDTIFSDNSAKSKANFVLTKANFFCIRHLFCTCKMDVFLFVTMKNVLGSEYTKLGFWFKLYAEKRNQEQKQRRFHTTN